MHDHELLERILDAQLVTLKTQREILHLLQQQQTHHKPAVGFKITQHRGAFAMNTGQTLSGLAPGTSGTLTISPVDVNGNPTTLPTGIVPAWSFSDTNVSATPSADGLSCAVSVPSVDIANPTATVTVTATLADGSTISSTATFPIDPAAVSGPAPVAGFTFTQS